MSESQGAKLKRIRLEKGLTLEDVQKKTKLHIDVIKAIEEDSIINVKPVYLRGFLKIYCRFLGVDPRECIPDYKEPKHEIITPEFSPPAKEKTPAMNLASKKLDFLKKINFKLVIGSVLALGLAFLLVRGIFALGKFIASRPPAAVKQVVKENKPVPAKTVKDKKQMSPAPVKPKEKPVVLVSGVRLGISAREDCWVQVKVDGKLAFQRVLKKSRSEVWEAKNKIELSLSNAGAVSLEVNGQLVSSLGRRGQAVKNILITKEGLNISR